MADITYYVALPFTEDETGDLAAGQAEEFQSPDTAIRRAETLARLPENIGAIAFSRAGDPMIGEFRDAVVLKSFGQVPDDTSVL